MMPTTFGTWFANSVEQLLQWVTKHVAPEVGLEFYPEHLRQCFTFINENGERVVPPEWELRPGSREASDKYGCMRSQATKEWHCLKESSRQFVPLVWQRHQQGV